MFSEEQKQEIRKIFKRSLFKRILGLEYTESDIVPKVVRSHKLTPAQKCIVLIDMYKYYFTQGIIGAAKMETYELHYEEFIKNGQKDEVVFQELYDYCFNDILFFHAVTLTKAIDDIKKQGVNESELSQTKKEYVELIEKLKDDCGFDENFDYPAFYYNSELRNDISHKMRWFLKDYEKLIDNDQYEIGIN